MPRRVFVLLVVTGLFVGPLRAANPRLTPPTHPEPWQAAGIRAAFGDERSPNPESSPEVQREALKLCAQLGWGEALDPREVAVYLASKDAELRHYAAVALSQMGEAGAPFARESAMSVDPAEQYGISVADYLSAFGPGVVIGLLSDPAPRMRRDALAAVTELSAAFGRDPTVALAAAEAATRLLEDKDASVRMSAALALCDLEEGDATLASRIASFFSGLEVDERGELALKLASHPDAVESMAKDFAPMFESRSVAVRCQAANACEKMGADGARFGQQLVSLLGDSNSEVRGAVLHAFAKIGPAASSFVTQIAAELKDPTAYVRHAAEFALGNLGPEGAKYAPEIAEQLKNPNEAERFCAIAGLCGMGEAAGRFAPEIARLLPVKDYQSQKQISIALVGIGQEGAAYAKEVAFMMKGLGLPGPFPLGHPSKEFLQKTVNLFDDESADVRAAAAHLLGMFTTDAAPCVSRLMTQLLDSDREARAAAIRALPLIDPDGAEFLPKIAGLLDDDEFVVRAAAVWAVGRVAPETMEWNAKIARGLRDPNPGPQAYALDALKRRGRASGFAKELAAVLEAPIPDVRLDTHHMALEALDTLKDLDPQVLREAVPSLLNKSWETNHAAFKFFDHHGNDKGDLDLQADLLQTANETPKSERDQFRAHLRLWSGGNAALQRSVTWLGNPDLDPMPKEGLPAADLPGVLGMLRDLWDHSAAHGALRAEIATRIAQVAKTTTEPDAETTKVLEALRDELENDKVAAEAEAAIRTVLEKQRAREL